MLLVAVTGAVGAGKTTRLAALAAWAQARGKRVDGFLARAGERPGSGKPAARYDLEWIASGETTPFALRDEAARAETGVPYRFDADTSARVRTWAEGLAEDPPDLVLLDEFGRAEAEGHGHLPAWPAIVAADPAVVVIAAREEWVEGLEARLGRPFDARVDAAAPEADDRLRALCTEHDDWTRVGLYGAGAGGIEVTVGSALHAGKVPLRGFFLSTTEAVVMAYAGDGLAHRPRVVWVPFVSAGLKALSPAGNRLRPMLAITVEGLLFSGAVRALGWNRLAMFVGGALAGAWAGAQGFLLQYLLVGRDLLRAYDALVAWAAARGWGAPGLAALVAGWVALHALGAGAITAWAWRRRRVAARIERAVERGVRSVPIRERAASRGEAWRGALRDLTRPSFWLPIVLVAAVVVAAGAPWERAFWIGVRAATVGLVVFALARRVDPKRIAAWLRRRGRWGPAEALDRAVGKRGSHRRA
ncbi:MAG TPA: DUF2478 domain-containing protein [Rubricoccaceae bacterium]|nr:DUF2478 domain-containing protein [Rubricoccaceae bacterium]